MSTAISVRIPKELANRLDSIAKETQRPRSFIIQKALESYIENFADLRIALDRLHDKGDQIVSSNEVRKSNDVYKDKIQSGSRGDFLAPAPHTTPHAGPLRHAQDKLTGRFTKFTGP